MAYKIQIGNAAYSGSIIQKSGDFDAGTNAVSGSDVLSEGDVDAGGKITITQGGIQLENANTDEQQIKITSGGSDRILIGNTLGSEEDGCVLEIVDAGQSVVEIGVDPDGNKIAGHTAGAGFVIFRDRNGTPVTHMELEGETGEISGSGEIKVGGTLTIGGNLTVNGDYTDTQTNTISLPAFETTDQTLELDHADGAGIDFGASAAGGSLRVADSESQWSGSINMSASAWYGSGGQLTGVTAGGLALSINELTNNATCSLGFNVINSSLANTVTLPQVNDAASQVQNGTQITIKNEGSGDLTVQRHANASDSSINIDGSESSVILYAGASIKCILSASDDNSVGGWWIF